MHDPEFIQWLLNAQTPSIRYLTLRHLLNQPESDEDVQLVRGTMKTSGPIPAIFARQTKTGAWAGEQSFYTPKYTSTHWSMLLLAELAVDGKDSGLRRGALYMLGDAWDRLQERTARSEYGWTCLWGNILRYTLHCSFDDDPRLRMILESVIADALTHEWRCEYNDNKPCAWGAARALWGLALLPEYHLAKPEIEETIQSGISLLLEKHNLVAGDYPYPKGGKVSPYWTRLNFPLFYQVDILFVLRTLADLKRLDHPGAAPALDWLRERRLKNGHWRGASPFRTRTWRVLGEREETDRWVSFHAARVLSKVGNQI